MSRRPDLFIVGAAKAGTTSLYSYLADHPQVFMSRQKEPRYFAPDLLTGTVADGLRYGEDFDRYMSLFATARDEKRLGEASVRYLYSREAPRLIHEFEPEAFIIVLVRNPVDMAYSLHHDRLARGLEDIADFGEALAAEDDRRAGRRIPRGSHPTYLLYRDWARLGEQVARWLEVFGRDRVLVTAFEDLVRDPAGALETVLRFIDVEPKYRPRSFEARNPSHAPRSRLLRDVVDLPGPLIRRALPPAIRNRLRLGLVRRVRRMNMKPVSRPPLAPALRAQLEKEFATDVALLNRLAERDLAQLWWPHSSAATGRPGS